ncbi:AraC family transcriptional regulator [Halalkalibacterium halodurans]|uniref:AraC family transcriptional regulator n=1 Tax=Halalkalibacterium halodurans TaxID=86665 RepID=UPI002E1B75A4|nr:AraC family transcriptional regulator [Halalkalibacterium halodurans]
MSYIQSVQRAIDYIETHLHEPISLEKVAAHASYSYFHFHRLFKATVGCTMSEYIKRRRLTKAAYALLETKASIIDIAFEYGYESQEAFTRAFKQWFNVLPGKYRQARPPVQLIDPYWAVKTFPVNATSNHKPYIVTRQPLQVVGLQLEGLSLPGGSDREQSTLVAIPTLWHQFEARIHEIERRVDPFVSYGISSPSSDGSHFTYMACVEVEASDVNIPQGFIQKEIKGGTYASFHYKGAANQLSALTNYIYGSWLPSSQYQSHFGVEIEVYDEREPKEDDEVAVEIWTPIKKRAKQSSQK